MARKVAILRSDMEEILPQANIPEPLTGEADDRVPLWFNGVSGFLVAQAKATREHDSCETFIETIFWLELLYNNVVDVGHLDVVVIDRTHMPKHQQTNGKKIQATWVTKYLGPDRDPTTDSRTHHPEDDVTEVQRTIKPLYDSNGEPNAGMPHELDDDSICIVSLFENEDGLRRLGSAQMTMGAGFRAIARLPAPLAFRGMYILSPAPMDTHEGMTNQKWQATTDKVEASYHKSGYQLLRQGSRTLKYAIRIMGQASTPGTLPQPSAVPIWIETHSKHLTNRRGIVKPKGAIPAADAPIRGVGGSGRDPRKVDRKAAAMARLPRTPPSKAQIAAAEGQVQPCEVTGKHNWNLHANGICHWPWTLSRNDAVKRRSPVS